MQFRPFALSVLALLAACTDQVPAPADAAGLSDPLRGADVADVNPGHDDGKATQEPDVALTQPPTVARVWLGVEGLPEALMGQAPGGPPFRWALPRQGFRVDVHAQADGPLQAAPTVQVALDGVETPLSLVSTGGWQPDPPDGQRWTAEVPAGVLPATDLKLRAIVGAVPGPWVPLRVAERVAAVDPFENPDPWLVILSRDAAKLEVTWQGDTPLVATVDGADGQIDLDQSLAALGLQGGDAKWNAGLRALFRERLRAVLRQLFLQDPATGALQPDSIRVQIWLEGDQGVPKDGLSRIAIGGKAPLKPGKKRLFGLAKLDPRNDHADDDSQPGWGVFTFSMVAAVLENPLGVALLKDVLPTGDGQPFGSLPEDAALLDPALDPLKLPEDQRPRAELFRLVTRLLVLGVASVTAHEMGHSLGLIEPGLPPHGLLGGVAGPWVVQAQDSHHLDTAGPNLMQTGDSFNPTEILAQTPAFSPLEAGYLRRRLLVLLPGT